MTALPLPAPPVVTHARVLGIAVPMIFAHVTTPLLGIVSATAIGRLGEGGPVAVASSGLFVQVQPGHFRTHGRAAEVEAAIAAGDAGPRAELNP